MSGKEVPMLLKRTILGSCVVLAIAFGSPVFGQEKLSINQSEVASIVSALTQGKAIVCPKSHNPIGCARQYDAVIHGALALGAAGLRVDEARAKGDVTALRQALIEVIQVSNRNLELTAQLRAEYLDPHYKGTRPISLVK